MEIFAASQLVPVSSPPVAGGAIAVRDGRIIAVGPLTELRRSYPWPVTEFPDGIIVPGLVNAHSHLELTHFPSWLLRKGVGYSPRTWADWVVQVIKIRRALTADEVAHSVREGLRKSLEAGTTFLGEIVTSRDVVPLYHSSRISGRLYLELIGHDPVLFGPSLRAAAELAAGLHENFSGGLSPHTPFTASDQLLRQAGTAAAERGLPLAIHVAEPAAESEFLFSSTGPIADILFPFVHWEEYVPPPRHTSSVPYLDALGLLGPRTLAVHCVHVTPDDAAILAARKTGIALCPRSNDRLNVGTAPLHLFRKAGLRIGLGTDSLASNDSLSMFDEMRFLVDTFPEVSPADALAMATIGSASVLAAGTEAGSLEPGKRADFLVLRDTGSSRRELLDRILFEAHLDEVYLAGTRSA